MPCDASGRRTRSNTSYKRFAGSVENLTNRKDTVRALQAAPLDFADLTPSAADRAMENQSIGTPEKRSRSKAETPFKATTISAEQNQFWERIQRFERERMSKKS